LGADALSELADAVAALRRGELVAAPTETLVGLLADARSADAVARVVEAKGRAEGKPIGVILPDVDALQLLAEPVSSRVEALARAFWPGPLGLIVAARPGLPEALLAQGKLAVRVPGQSRALELVRAFGGALTSTSANLASAPPVRCTSELEDSIAASCAVVLCGEAGSGEPSTLLDVGTWPPRCVREGAVPRERWEACVRRLG
jgi:L-threonylcarbamoyladenylate synthase